MKTKVLPSVAFIGGIKEGKTSLITELWANGTKSSENVIFVNDNIPGRGEMNYKVVELPPIIYSLSKRWVSNNYNLEVVKESDVLVFVLPAESLGYKEELLFIERIIKSPYYNNQHIVICLSKTDLILYNDEVEQINADSIFLLQKNTASLYNSLRKVCSEETFDISSIVATSVAMKWNYLAFKEKIWEGVISKTNDNTFDPALPTIVIAGKRGCGKSSTLNRLWGLELPTNKAVACTKYPMVISVKTKFKGKEKQFNVVDLPGIAESLEADMQYTQFYDKYIKYAKVLICLSQADTRAYLQDQIFYTNLIYNRIITKDMRVILGINQIDLLFKSKENLSGIDLHTITDNHPLIMDKIDDYYNNVYSKIFKDHPSISVNDVCVYSVLQDWNVDKLENQLYNKLFN